jgi:CTP synthase (UTP-ammonia lyase)
MRIHPDKYRLWEKKKLSLALNPAGCDDGPMTSTQSVVHVRGRVNVSGPTRLALVGDRSASVRAHTRIPLLIEALLRRYGLVLDAYWVATLDVAATALDRFDAIWLMPGSPYQSVAGALTAAGTARQQQIPFLGTCGGFQHALLEYARSVCGLRHVDNAETSPDALEFLIVPLEYSLIEQAVNITPGSLAGRILGTTRSLERYRCAYGLNPGYTGPLTAHGLRFTGHDDDGQVRIAELPEHPFYLATLFQPELHGDGTRPHPIIRALAQAAIEHAMSRPRSG